MEVREEQVIGKASYVLSEAEELKLMKTIAEKHGRIVLEDGDEERLLSVLAAKHGYSLLRFEPGAFDSDTSD